MMTPPLQRRQPTDRLWMGASRVGGTGVEYDPLRIGVLAVLEVIVVVLVFLHIILGGGGLDHGPRNPVFIQVLSNW